MEVVVTAVGPDNVGLADPIIHYVTGRGASIAEIQMYDHDEEAVFAMMCRIHFEGDLRLLRQELADIGRQKQLSLRTWSPDGTIDPPRLALCTTYRPEPALALLRAIRDGQIPAQVAVMVGNRPVCRGIAEQFRVPWCLIGDESGNPNEAELVQIMDSHHIDYIVLARYMRVLSAATCWKYAGGRIINLHHGLLPGFPGMQPYHDAYRSRMLSFGATCHFIVPELDAGNQIIQQTSFTVPPGTSLQEIIRRGREDNEPRCLVDGLRRVVMREVQLHFHRVIARPR